MDALEERTQSIYEELRERAENRAFRDEVESGSSFIADESFHVGIVPGALYRRHHQTGADGLHLIRLLSSLGIKNEVIPVKNFGRLRDNAAIINHWLSSQSARRIVLISLSKGTADAKIALRESPASWDKVTAWISFSGLWNGTPLVDWIKARPLRWIGVHLWLWSMGERFAAAEDLRLASGTVLAGDPAIPPHLRLIHLLGCPLRAHLRHRWAPKAFRRLEPLGCNDGGGILLEDTLRWPGIVYPLWAVDHYLQNLQDDPALLTAILAAAARPGG